MLIEFIQNVLKTFPHWTINDVLNTEEEVLLDVMHKEATEKVETGTKSKTKAKKIIPMHEFLSGLKGG